MNSERINGIPLVEVRHLKKYFVTAKGLLHAVDDVNFSINKGQTLGVVGESGCGKSTLGRTMLRLLSATAGEVLYRKDNILNYNKKNMRNIYRKMQMIFQDPFSSLNPRMAVSDLISEPMKVCKVFSSSKEMNDRVLYLMDVVGLSQRYINSYPHELDGGRRQRIGIARALALDPEFIVCDEPVSALDVSIQAQILNLMMDLQETMELTYMFITHDLSVVKHISNRVAVMYLGQCVEIAATDEIFASPLHPYTQALLNAILVPNLRYRKAISVIKGEVTSPVNPEPGCRFAPRCPFFNSECKENEIPLREITKNHFVSCTLF